MSTLFKKISRERIIRFCLGGFALPGKFRSLLFFMYGLCSFNILFFGLTSCSTKTFVTKLKSLQTQPITESNQTVEPPINYPIKTEKEVVFNDNYSFETFIIIISIIFLFCFLNSEYPSKIVSFFKKK